MMQPLVLPAFGMLRKSKLDWPVPSFSSATSEKHTTNTRLSEAHQCSALHPPLMGILSLFLTSSIKNVLLISFYTRMLSAKIIECVTALRPFPVMNGRLEQVPNGKCHKNPLE